MAEIGDSVLNGRYLLLRQVKGCIGGPRTVLGEKGVCRYRGSRNPKIFRKIAHAIPEALGNKWITSADECDACNHAFSLYEDALANSVSPSRRSAGLRARATKSDRPGGPLATLLSRVTAPVRQWRRSVNIDEIG